MHVHIVLYCGAKGVLFTNKLSECWCRISNPYIPTILVRELHNMHVHIILGCGVKTVLFTSRLSECWCPIINPYLLTKFHTSKHLGKRVTQTCMFTLFFVVVRKGSSMCENNVPKFSVIIIGKRP